MGQALVADGLAPGEGRPTWRLPVAELAGLAESHRPGEEVAAAPHLARVLPRSLRPWSDPRLLLAQPGGGHILGIPDVAGPWRAAGGPLGLAGRAAKRQWETAVVLELEGDPSVMVPRLAAAASAAGYTWLVTPWPPGAAGPPEAVHRIYSSFL